MRSAARRAFLSALILAAGLCSLPVPAGASEPRSISDTRGPHSFETAPQRVISLNWAQTEQLLGLDIVPLGVADPKGYADWVAVPPIPTASVDVGKREAPNLERILGLQPDLLLLGGQQAAFVEHLEPVAPVLQFELFDEDHDNAAAIRQNFLDLATLLDRRDLAEARLAEMDAKLAGLKAEIAAAYPGGVPKVTLVRFIDDKRVVISGTNGMPEAAMKALGLETGFPVENSRWGIAFKPVTALASIGDGYVMHIEPFEKGQLLFGTALWQEMPFVKAGRFRTLPPLWTYGGALSVGRIGEEIARALLADKS